MNMIQYKNKVVPFLLGVVMSFLAAIASLVSGATPPPYLPALLFFGLGIVFLGLAVREFRARRSL